MIWDFIQHRQIVGLGNQIEGERRSAEALAKRVEELEAAVEHLSVVARAVWTVASRATGLSDEALEAEILALEEKENALIACAKCGRTVSPKRGHCIYCGAPTPQGESGAGPA